MFTYFNLPSQKLSYGEKRKNHLYFTDEETEIQRGKLTWMKLQLINTRAGNPAFSRTHFLKKQFMVTCNCSPPTHHSFFNPFLSDIPHS